MKKKIKYALKKIVAPLSKKVGLVDPIEINYLSKDNLLVNLISIIKSNDFEPNVIFDIGANHGTWSRIWKLNFPESRFVLIEPQYWLKPSFEDLLDEKTEYLPIGVGSRNDSAFFTINSERDDSSTFLWTAEEARSLGFNQIEVKVKTLNSIVSESKNIFPDIVKIDAEGMDIEVLKGATDLFGKTEIFMVEASINSTYNNSDICSIINFMDDNGYRVFDITDLNRPFHNHVLWLIELVFVKRGGFFDKIKWM